MIRLYLEEQSILCLHCLSLPICPKTLDHYSKEGSGLFSELYVHPAGDVLWVFVEPGNVVP